MVQVKGGKPRRSIGPKDWNRLYDLAHEAGAVPVLANKTESNRWAFWLLADRKDGTGRRQPVQPYAIEQRQNR